jgi:hypothetical protein
MKKNMGKIDKGTRLVVAMIFVILNLTHVTTGILGIALLVFAIIFALTSYLSFCPLYLPFNISTKEKEE